MIGLYFGLFSLGVYGANTLPLTRGISVGDVFLSIFALYVLRHCIQNWRDRFQPVPMRIDAMPQPRAYRCDAPLPSTPSACLRQFLRYGDVNALVEGTFEPGSHAVAFTGGQPLMLHVRQRTPWQLSVVTDASRQVGSVKILCSLTYPVSLTHCDALLNSILPVFQPNDSFETTGFSLNDDGFKLFNTSFQPDCPVGQQIATATRALMNLLGRMPLHNNLDTWLATIFRERAPSAIAPPSVLAEILRVCGDLRLKCIYTGCLPAPCSLRLSSADRIDLPAGQYLESFNAWLHNAPQDVPALTMQATANQRLPPQVILHFNPPDAANRWVLQRWITLWR